LPIASVAMRAVLRRDRERMATTDALTSSTTSAASTSRSRSGGTRDDTAQSLGSIRHGRRPSARAEVGPEPPRASRSSPT
jgi:hypothetical protein